MSVQTYIDGTEVTSVVLNGSSTRRLNRPSQASCRIPVQSAIGSVGSRLKVVVNGSIFFHGMVMTLSDEADENTGYSQYEATDPMELWNWRPARDQTGPTPGNMITPTFFERLKYGPLIMQEILLATQDPTRIASIPRDCDDPGDLGVGSTAEGPLFISIGTIEGGSTADLSGAPTNFPMTIAEVASLLTSTGTVDIVLDPIDSGGNMASVSVYNGAYGSDLSGSVSFDFATGQHNARSVRQVQDMSNITNKLQYFFGPKETLERYKANITADDNFLSCAPFDQNAIEAIRDSSRAAYGVRMEIQEFDVDVIQREDQCNVDCGDADPVRMLYRALWQQESWIRAQPRRLVHIEPVRGVGIGSFDIGDEIAVNAGTYLRGGFSGKQRIFEYTINWDTDGIMELTELVTSPNADGL